MAYPYVYFFPAEYNSYGAGASVCISLKTDENAVWKRHYNITDQLGNTRLVLREDAADPRGFRILGEYNYEAYGRMRPVLDTDPSQTRMRYIGKERDEESLLADHGVRKYDYDLGRFTCPDPMWEKYYSWTPYQYAACNPVSMMDPSGLTFFQFGQENNKGDFAINDGSNAVFKVNGSGIKQHFKFIGYDQNQGGENQINFETAIEQAQDLNMKNEALQENDGTPFCNYGTLSILSMMASTPCNENLSNINGKAFSMIDKMINLGYESNQVDAINNAKNGGLSIEAIDRGLEGKGRSDHVASLSVGINIQKGIIANIGTHNQYQSLHNTSREPKGTVIRFFIIPIIK